MKKKNIHQKVQVLGRIHNAKLKKDSIPHQAPSYI